jgi:hypothetical protein
MKTDGLHKCCHAPVSSIFTLDIEAQSVYEQFYLKREN